MRLVTAMIVSLCLFGCATTQQARSVKPTGFLGNYSQLKAGEGDQALRRYVAPNVQWRRYTKIMLQPVQIYAGRSSDLSKASPQERQALANYFTAALREQLQKDYGLVTRPGPDVMTIRAAITDADESEVLLDTVTTIMPIGLALSTMKRVVGGSDSFVGDAQAEMELVDSTTGQRLAAAVDKRIGTKALRSKFGTWNHAKECFDYWAEQLRERLAEGRKGTL
jgi:hypothetical protein